MTGIILSGCFGRMGQAVISAAAESDSLSLLAGVDSNLAAGSSHSSFPVYLNISDYTGNADVIVDFSHHTAVTPLCKYAKERKIPIVIATTGHTEEETELIKQTSKYIPVFYSRNMSVGVNLIIELAKKAAAMLGSGFDIEIIEKHHNQKLDAPSGTALMIADAVSEVIDTEPEYIYSRQSVRKKRDKNEIGIHSIRGGTIVGEHDILFAGNQETVTISHTATSRAVFAHGALRAAEFIVGKPAGLYNMTDIVNGIEL